MSNVPPERDHGLPNDSTPVEPPLVACELQEPCGNPGCNCNRTFGIVVRLEHPELGDCWGYFRGCAACPWASSMHVQQKRVFDFPFAKLN